MATGSDARKGAPSPLVTAGLRCFNAEGTIERALDSAMGQDWPNLEILVVDDGSSDASPAIVERLARADPRIRLVRHDTNRGAAVACNTILAEAKGEFVCFFDDDDVSRADRVLRQVRRITEYEAATGVRLVLCHAAFVGIAPDGSRSYRSALGGDRTPAPQGRAVAELILIGRPVEGRGETANCSLMARASAFRAVGGFDDALDRLHDTDFALRVAEAGGHFAGLSAPLVEKYQSGPVERAGLAAKRVRGRRANEQFIEKHRETLEALSWYRFTVDWLPLKTDLLGRRWGRALVRGLCLFARYPVKTVKRILWSAPNLHRYRHRFRSLEDSPNSPLAKA